jgi:hypothetical protein
MLDEESSPTGASVATLFALRLELPQGPQLTRIASDLARIWHDDPARRLES